MTRIIDTFLFNDELDMLEVRLTELASHVDRFVLVEADVTHRGLPKPMYYAQNRERFSQWNGKITHVTAKHLPDSADPWKREHAQRDAAVHFLDAGDDDIVLISDVDEFPPPQFLHPDPSSVGRQGLGADPAVTFLQRTCAFAVDWEYGYEPCAVAARVGYARRHGLAAVRDSRARYPVIRGGWHFTWLGGAAQKAKLATHCHLEITPRQEELVRSGWCWRHGTHFNGTPLAPVTVDESWPQMICQRRCPPDWFR
jgi:hypothetical protein